MKENPSLFLGGVLIFVLVTPLVVITSIWATPLIWYAIRLIFPLYAVSLFGLVPIGFPCLACFLFNRAYKDRIFSINWAWCGQLGLFVLVMLVTFISDLAVGEEITPLIGMLLGVEAIITAIVLGIISLALRHEMAAWLVAIVFPVSLWAAFNFRLGIASIARNGTGNISSQYTSIFTPLVLAAIGTATYVIIRIVWLQLKRGKLGIATTNDANS